MPNFLSFLRLVLVPVFLVLVISAHDALALLVLVLSSVTDFFDGLIARTFKQVSHLGRLLDPAADRLFIFAALIGLTVRDIIPLWLFIAIVLRDVMLIGLGIMLVNHGHGPLPVHRLGKIATLCVFFALPTLMLGRAFPDLMWFADPLGWAFVLWGVLLYWWAGVIYITETIRVVRISRVEISRVEVGPESDTLNG